jgi:uncharacterized protein (TIGR02271 family)
MAEQGKEKRTNYIVGLFRDEASAERCIGELKQANIDAGNISLAMHREEQERQVAQETGVSRVGQEGGLGGIMSMLGMGGGLIRSLQDMGFSKDTAQYYADRVDAGSILLAVKCDGLCERATSIFDKYGAFDVRSNVTMAARGETRPTAEHREIPIREERLVPHKEEHRIGEVTVTKEVVEEERTMRVPVAREEVTVEHKPVERRPAEQGPREETIRIPIVEEEVRISKEPVVTGEIEITKRPVTEEREFKATVRKEVPHVEKKGELREEELGGER